MANIEKFLEEAAKKGHGVIVAVGGKAKEFGDKTKAFTENLKTLRQAEEALHEEIYNLGLSFYESYKNAKKNSPTRIKFEKQIDYITELTEERDICKATFAETFGKKCCENCGATLKAEDAFCSQCGAPVEEDDDDISDAEGIKHCQNCGAEHSKDQKFCSKCGSKLIK